MKEIRPTRFLGVPRIWEKIQEKLLEVGAQNNPLKKAIANWAKSQAAEYHKERSNGKQVKPSWQYKLARRLIFR